MMGNPVRYPFGVSTRASTSVLGNYPMPDPAKSGSLGTLGVAEYFSDFTTLPASVYTVTGTSSTFAVVAAGVGGQAILTPGGTTTASSAYLATEPFQFVSGQQAWFRARYQVSAVAGNVAYQVGLQNGASVQDAIIFQKAAASTALKLTSAVANTSTDLLTSLNTEAAATWTEVGFYFNGTDLLAFVNGVLVGRVASPTIGATNTYNLTNKALSPVFQITPTATDTLTVDHVLAASEIVR